MDSRVTGKLQCHYGEIMHRIAIYDMDKTITRKSTFGPFLFYAVPRHQPWRLIFAPLLFFTILAFVLRWIDRAQLKVINLELMLGKRIRRTELDRLSEGFAGRTLANNVLKGALDRIASDRAEGYRIVMATASYRFYVTHIARLLGIADVIATETTELAEEIAPAIQGENCYGDAKLATVELWLNAQGIKREDAHIRFYSDHVTDAPCLGWANEGYATNPHEPLRQLAKERDWTVFDWR